MPIEPLFSISEQGSAELVTFTFDGRTITAPNGINIAAALLVGGVSDFRASVVGHDSRGPYCMMGVCFECLVEVDGVPARQSCLIPVREGMQVHRQDGAASLGAPDLGDNP